MNIHELSLPLKGKGDREAVDEVVITTMLFVCVSEYLRKLH